MLRLKVAVIFALLGALTVSITDGRRIRQHRTPRILGGHDAAYGEFPYMASLQRNTSIGYLPECSGAIVDKYHVLTIANCVYEEFEEDWIVAAGMLNIYNQSESGRVQFPVAQFYLHRAFDDANKDLDIALVRINGEFPLGTPSISTVPVRNATVPVGATCTVTGWGSNGTIDQSILQAVDVTKINQTECVSIYEDYFFNVLPGMECFGNMAGGHDICVDDFGDPLVCDGQLSGIASWTIPCALELYPSVYSDVVYYHDWYVDILAQSYADAGLSRE